ncbi:histidine phosphatase family protein [Nakamurella leprariae]|uniref:Histidine phosphatase family protein n=1 Tax=Nakamurella leprariae TaxID=2803911 RepID=A0A938YDY5_9ACTN|nr:histidine phosphatase family protein [Nakamurella leprariae]MBM9467803.1 histidine phosphatase family protein [Nakamurella leprariae]
MTILLLARHGQTPSNAQGLLDTAVPGPSLTELGRQQAQALADAIAHQPVRTIWASNQTRAQETAEPAAAQFGLPVGVLPGLREVDAGDMEMANDRPSVDRYLHALGEWMQGRFDVRMPGGELGYDVIERYDRAIEDAVSAVSSDDGAVLVVSHGAIIRTWATVRAQNLEPGYGSRNPLSNTGVVVLEGDPERGWNAVQWMDQAIGGPEVSADGADGPAADPAPLDVTSAAEAAEAFAVGTEPDTTDITDGEDDAYTRWRTRAGG